MMIIGLGVPRSMVEKIAGFYTTNLLASTYTIFVPSIIFHGDMMRFFIQHSDQEFLEIDPTQHEITYQLLGEVLSPVRANNDDISMDVSWSRGNIVLGKMIAIRRMVISLNSRIYCMRHYFPLKYDPIHSIYG